jgi:hypothetical protein
MQTQDLIEVQKDSTYTFTYFKESQNTLVPLSSATIKITDSAGNVLQDTINMTISSDVATYAWDSTGNDAGLNYQVIFTINSEPIVRLFDIMLYPFRNDVTDDDVINEYKSIKNEQSEASGTSQSGTTTTLVDLNRGELNDHWNGGEIQIYQNQSVFTRTVTDFVLSTNTITFSPALETAVSTDDYTIRTSFQDEIDRAGKNVQLHFRALEKRAYLVLDNYTLKRLIVFEVLKQYFFGNIKDDTDEFSIKYTHYADRYKTEMESLKLVYDEDGSGTIDDDETDNAVGQPTWYR